MTETTRENAMDAILKIEAALAAGPTEGDWELCYLNTPLPEVGAYVQKCVDVSGGENYHFIRAVRADGVPIDVAHYGNGPTSNVNGHWATVTQPAAIREVLQTLAAKDAEMARLKQELNEASVAEFGAQSANRHLSALVDFERQVSERCMAVMKALMDAAEPVNNEFQDCHIDYAEYAKLVDAHAELLYVIKNGERPALTQPTEQP